jgi:hypothetical protein
MMSWPFAFAVAWPRIKKIVDFLVDEVTVTLEVVLVGIQTCSDAEEALELRHVHHRCHLQSPLGHVRSRMLENARRYEAFRTLVEQV